MLHQVPEEFGFPLGELMIQLGVSRDLDGNDFSGFVVASGDDLGKAALAQDFENLEAVEKLLAFSNQIVAFLIIVFGSRLLVRLEGINGSFRSEASRVEVHGIREFLRLHLI